MHSLVVHLSRAPDLRYNSSVFACTVSLCTGFGVFQACRCTCQLTVVSIVLSSIGMCVVLVRCHRYPHVLPSKTSAAKDNKSEREVQASQLACQRQCQHVLEQQTVSTRRTALHKVKQAKLARSSAYNNIRAMGHSMSLAGIPLDRFRVADLSTTSRPLGENDARYYVPSGAAVDGAPIPLARLAIKDIATGAKRRELGPVSVPRPLVAMTLDQGSTVYSARFFMQDVLHMRLLVFVDTHHRCWNDAMNGVIGARMKYLL